MKIWGTTHKKQKTCCYQIVIFLIVDEFENQSTEYIIILSQELHRKWNDLAAFTSKEPFSKFFCHVYSHHTVHEKFCSVMKESSSNLAFECEMFAINMMIHEVKCIFRRKRFISVLFEAQRRQLLLQNRNKLIVEKPENTLANVLWFNLYLCSAMWWNI